MCKYRVWGKPMISAIEQLVDYQLSNYFICFANKNNNTDEDISELSCYTLNAEQRFLWKCNSDYWCLLTLNQHESWPKVNIQCIDNTGIAHHCLHLTYYCKARQALILERILNSSRIGPKSLPPMVASHTLHLPACLFIIYIDWWNCAVITW